MVLSCCINDLCGAVFRGWREHARAPGARRLRALSCSYWARWAHRIAWIMLSKHAIAARVVVQRSVASISGRLPSTVNSASVSGGRSEGETRRTSMCALLDTDLPPGGRSFGAPSRWRDVPGNSPSPRRSISVLTRMCNDQSSPVCSCVPSADLSSVWSGFRRT